jgi:signal transduction histidine kinase
MAVDNSRHFRDAHDAIRVRDDFVSIAGHELKTPLAALQLQAGGLERLLERKDGPPDLVRLRERLVKIGNHSRRLERLINELLDVSRITSGRLRLELEETDLAGLLSEIVARFDEEGALQGAPIRLDASIPVRGRWDRLRLDQVITNLISNAIKYGRKNPIDLTVSRKDGTAVVSVRDYGIGIDAAAQSRIFERFERAVAGRNYGGFGLGLWIARQIVEAHQGKIRVESAPELGATFIVELPCA